MPTFHNFKSSFYRFRSAVRKETSGPSQPFYPVGSEEKLSSAAEFQLTHVGNTIRINCSDGGVVKSFKRDEVYIAHRNFRWNTMAGEVLNMDQMSDDHLANSFKLVFNQTAPLFGLDPVIVHNNDLNRYESARDAGLPPNVIPQVQYLLVIGVEITYRGMLIDHDRPWIYDIATKLNVHQFLHRNFSPGLTLHVSPVSSHQSTQSSRDISSYERERTLNQVAGRKSPTKKSTKKATKKKSKDNKGKGDDRPETPDHFITQKRKLL